MRKGVEDAFVTRAGNIRSLRFGQLNCSILGPGQWDDAEWDEFLAHGDGQDPGAQVATLTLFLKALDVNASQRRKSAERAKRLTRVKRMAVLTGSAFTRGIVTAFGWITQKYTIKTFSPDELPQALSWLADSGANFDGANVQATIAAILREIEATAAPDTHAP